MIKDHLIENCKANAIDKIYRLPPRGKHSSIIQRFRPVLLGWWAEVQNRHMMWFHEVLMEEPENADSRGVLPPTLPSFRSPKCCGLLASAGKPVGRRD